MVGEGMLVGDALLRMHGRELQSPAVAGNGSVLVWLRLAACPTAVLILASQWHVTRCQAAQPFSQMMLLLPDVYSFLMVSRECWMLSGDVGFYSVLPLVCLPCYWLVGRACESGQVNDYWSHGKGRFVSNQWLWSCCFLQCMEQSVERELLCGKAATGHVDVPTSAYARCKLTYTVLGPSSSVPKTHDAYLSLNLSSHAG